MELGEGSVLAGEAESQLRSVPLFTHWKSALTGSRCGRLLVQNPESGESDEYIGLPRISPNKTGQLFSLPVSQFPYL